MNILASWVDNPLFVKHMRSRLRRAQFLPAGAVVLVLCLCISYGGYALNGFANGGAFGTLLGLQSIILAIIGATQVTSAVGGARESGIIDFHRVSPLSPLAVTLGFFFGAPVREYALFLLTVPFSLICVANDAPSLVGFLETMLMLVLSAWTLHALALLTSLSSKKPKGGAKGAVGLLVFLFIFGGQVGFFAMSRAAAFVGAAPAYSFFGLPLHWLVYTLLFVVPSLFFLLLASVRKMRSERAHAYTKREAAICLAVQTLLVLGAVWGNGLRYLSLIVLYLLVVIACVMIVTATPSLGEYSKGVRRADRLGLSRLSYWDDLALNRVVLCVLCLIVLAGATVAWNFVENRAAPDAGGPISYSVTIATGVLVVAYFGLALQFFQLAMPRRGTSILFLFVFLVWLVPLVIATITGAAGMGENTSQFIAALSPLAGLALSTNLGGSTGSQTLQAAVLVPALVFAFLFNNLVTVARRRAVKAIRAATPDAAAKIVPTPDPLAV